MKLKSNLAKGIVLGIFIAFVLTFIFAIGFIAGRRNVSFWEKRSTFRDFVPPMSSQHGVIGTIDSLGKDTLVVKDRTGALRTVVVDSNTRIVTGRINIIKFSDLKKDEEIIVLGTPSQKDDSITARIIRVIEKPNSQITPSSTPSVQEGTNP